LPFLLRQIDGIGACSRHPSSVKRMVTEHARFYNTLPYLGD
jgi:hypothetical protein